MKSYPYLSLFFCLYITDVAQYSSVPIFDFAVIWYSLMSTNSQVWNFVQSILHSYGYYRN